MLELKNINGFYGKKHVLYNINLKIKENEKVLIIGSNGAGKSTLFKIIGGIVFPKTGNIFFKDTEITYFSSEKRINLGIGYLLQTGNVFVKLTVKENLELASYNNKNSFDNIFHFFPFLKEKYNKIAGLLSRGERQALAISMVLLKSPEFLLLDEPTSGLSPKAVKQMFEYINKLQNFFNIKTVCMIEHNLKFALKWATRMIILQQGKIISANENPLNYLDSIEKLEEIFFKDSS